MSWEKRLRGGLYYTRTRSVNGQVRREYVGPEGCELTEEIAEIDRQMQAHRLAQREALREYQQRERELVEHVEAVFPAARWVLLEAGCYEKKGRWRMAKSEPGLKKVEEQKQALKPLEGMSHQELVALANVGNVEAKRSLTKHFQAHFRGGTLQSGFADSLLTGLLPESSASGRAVILAGYEDIRAQLAGDVPTALESILAEAAALGWLHSTVADLKHAGAENLPQAMHYIRGGESAQRRMTRAIKTLAMVRRLRVPPIVLVAPAGSQPQRVDPGSVVDLPGRPSSGG